MKKKIDHIPDGTWVKAKISGGIRYVTRQVSKECFEDDGKKSNQQPSKSCRYNNYEPVPNYRDFDKHFMLGVHHAENEDKTFIHMRKLNKPFS